MSETITTPQSIREFAAAVRSALSDLPADDVDDLTDGLEADLTEQAADVDAGDAAAPNVDLGDPVAYADELRGAAGLPVRGTTPEVRVPRLGRLRIRIGEARARAARRICSSIAGAALLDFLLVLRPVWWVLRGWVVYAVVAVLAGGGISTVPTDPLRWVVLAAFVILSVQWGRGRWLPWRWLPRFRTLVSVCAVLVLPIVLLATAHNAGAQNSAYVDYNPAPTPGLMQNGQGVTNVFAYDADGQPLTDVQLFDQDGRALNVVNDPVNTNYLTQFDAAGDKDMVMPSLLVPGGGGWNVFPLRLVTSDDVDYTYDHLGQAYQADAAPAPFPFAQVRPLVELPAVEESSSTPAPALSPEPSAAPTLSPGPTASAAPTAEQ
ncbi:hypothetical protein E3O11_11240 [Cryobacterium levicorallinum]|uniref:Uncharacterized protein n=1 Tax=Cryobacterium levicorallinum TaxID=995038 RepID=A0A1I3B9E6_9MICO|nr:hypothetical protein [Cryobacterium levicorallinum]TFB83402.1 hypothetical protein E3O11_11240 [Cryobacterium levicorallinum]GEP26918.1 hypothetical protein CLE01_15160 [Cryobacterium levicorallinum]SFH58311.1 hypothetical protein SAMN05216274_108165 [Cryobacterium levicorallinum]